MLMVLLLASSNRFRSVRQDVVGDLRTDCGCCLAGAAEVHAAEGAGVDAVAGHVRDPRIAPRLHATFGRAGKDAVEGGMDLERIRVAENLLKHARTGTVRARMRGWIFGMVG